MTSRLRWPTGGRQSQSLVCDAVLPRPVPSSGSATPPLCFRPQTRISLTCPMLLSAPLLFTHRCPVRNRPLKEKGRSIVTAELGDAIFAYALYLQEPSMHICILDRRAIRIKYSPTKVVLLSVDNRGKTQFQTQALEPYGHGTNSQDCY